MFGPAHGACLAASPKARLGYIPDISAVYLPHVFVLFRNKFGVVTPTFPDSADKTSFEAPTEDQGSTGSCGGHGSSQLIASAYGSGAAAGICAPLGFVASPKDIYAGARRESSPATSSSAPPLTDGGINPFALLDWFQRMGVVPIGTDAQCPTPDGRYSDVWGPGDGPAIPNVNNDVTLGAEIAGRTRLDTSTHAVDCSGASGDVPSQLCPVLATPGMGLGLGIFVDTPFFQYNPVEGPLQGVANLADPNGGGHWVCGNAYRPSTAEEQTSFSIPVGTRIYTIKNSWGNGWGTQGRMEVTEGRLLSMLSQAIAVAVNPTSSTKVA